MNFGAHHYVPVLKVKRGEKNALQAIAAPLRSQITPLLEIVERRSERASTVGRHLDTAFQGLVDAVRSYRRCFLDTREIAPDGSSAAAAVFDRAAGEGMIFTPVTGISRIVDVAAALRHNANGIAVRLTRDEFEEGSLGRNLAAFLARNDLNHGGVDIIVDLGPVDTLVQDGVANFTTDFLNEVPDHTRWRTLTVSACAFPASMGGVNRNSYSLVERNEWKAWRDRLHSNRRRLSRLPTFSDCGIQHPAGVEGFDPRTMQASASVRYTLSEDWLLIKGEGTRTNPPSQQFPGLANQLVYGNLQSYFTGANHCVGCESMRDAAGGAPRLGSLEAWRRLGTIHHITMVMDCMASVPWP